MGSYASAFDISARAPGIVITSTPGPWPSRRDLESISVPTLPRMNVDLDGDGRDELLFHAGGSLRASRGDLEEQWSWPTRETIREIIPASPGRPATVVLNPLLGLDGATGRPIWSGGPARSILRAGDDKPLPRVLTVRDGTTVCRVAMPISAGGNLSSSAQGRTGSRPASLTGDDPRLERPLPWVFARLSPSQTCRYRASGGPADN